METWNIHTAYCHITSIPNCHVHYVSFHKHIPKNQGDTGQLHNTYCNMTLIHINEIQNLSNLEVTNLHCILSNNIHSHLSHIKHITTTFPNATRCLHTTYYHKYIISLLWSLGPIINWWL